MHESPAVPSTDSEDAVLSSEATKPHLHSTYTQVVPKHRSQQSSLPSFLTGIRQLQLILFKVALMLGVEIHVNVEFVRVLEPPEDQENQSTV